MFFYNKNFMTIAHNFKLNFSQIRTLRRGRNEIRRPANSFNINTENLEDQNPNLLVQNNKLEVQKSELTQLNDLKVMPTFNLAAYAKTSTSLQELIKLGVDLSRIEKRKGLPQFVMKLDFEKDVKPYLIFLNDLGVPAEKYGEMITKNPLLFKEDINNLIVRVNYLEAKHFKPQQIQRIVTFNPFWLMFSTDRIDKRLGYFQQNYKLSGDDIRFLATKQPRLITYNMEHIKKSHFTIKEEMGFDNEEIRCLLLGKPKLWMYNSSHLVERFDYVHRVMKLSHDTIIQFPSILTSRDFRIQQRHQFLEKLGKAQYNPEQDLYISPKSLAEGTDRDFVVNVAKSNMVTYDLFLRTL